MPHVSASSAFLFCTHKTENQASHFPNVPESSLEKSSWRRMPMPLALAQRDAGGVICHSFYSVDVVGTAVQHTAK